MADLPVVELTFQTVAGSPWEGSAVLRFNGETSQSISVREGLTSKQRDDIRWYIEEFMSYPEGGNVSRALDIESQLAKYGRELWSGLRSIPDAAVLLGGFIRDVQHAGGGRLELRADTARDEVAFRTPWELMRVGGGDNGGDGTLLHQLGVTVVRRAKPNVIAPVESLDTSGGLRVLAVVCRPDNTGFLDPRFTPEAIIEAVAGNPQITLDFCRPGTLAALTKTLEDAKNAGQPYHVVHFDGHGTTLPTEAGIGALCFENDDESLDLVRATQFGDLVSRFKVPLVVLEACRTSTKTLDRETVAGALVKQGVGSVVAMGHSVHVDMTRILMQSFYESVSACRSVGDALQAARNQVLSTKARRVRITADAPTVDLQDWFVPQLYQAGNDPVLVPKKPTRRSKKQAADPLFHGFGPEPKAGFHGRGRELHRLERLLIRERAVVIHAPGGMGKTTISREAAHWWLRSGLFPDGAIFVSFEENLTVARLIEQTGVALEGHDFFKRPESERADWIAEQFADRRLLLVWDNFESVLPAFQTGDTPPANHQGESEQIDPVDDAPQVFLSHSSADKMLARRLAADLRDAGVKVWFDEWEIETGDSITQRIQAGLRESDFVAVLLTRQSVEHGWVEKEWQSRINEEAKSGRKLILPLKADDCELPPLLADRAFADFTIEYAAGLKQLLRALGVPTVLAGDGDRRTGSHRSQTIHSDSESAPNDGESPDGSTAGGNRPDDEHIQTRLAEFAKLADAWTRGKTRLLVTCRDPEVGLDSSGLTARSFALGELLIEEGLMLLVGYLDKLGVPRSEREKRGWTADVLRPIVQGALGHPLALELLTPHVKALGPQTVIDDLGKLLASSEQNHHEGRNRSIGYSLEFSIRHLTDASREVLPAIALLSGGCIDKMAQDVTGLDDTAWQTARAEFERLGLIRVDDPWIRPHPVLDVYTSRLEQAPLHDRFLDAAWNLCGAFDQMVRTPDSKVALGLLGGCEVVIRRAIALAVTRGQLEQAVGLASSLKLFLELTGRGSEGADLMTDLARHMTGPDSAASGGGQSPDSQGVDARNQGTYVPRSPEAETLTEIESNLIREAAMSRARTQATAAAEDLTRLLRRLDRVQHWDTHFERASANAILGRIHYNFEHHPSQAIAPLQAAADLFAELEATGFDNGDTTNRAATLGDLANAYVDLGRFDEALAVAEQGLTLDRQRKDNSAVARGLGRIAQILQRQGEYTQAEQRYDEALTAARAAGDDEAEGILWQGLGVMHLDRKRPDEAVPALRQALDAFTRASDTAGQMQVLNSLGNADKNRGHAEAALAWYERSLELAVQLGDLQGQAAARSNRAILLSNQAQTATDRHVRQTLLNQTISEERESLAIQQQLGHPANIAISHNNLAGRLRLLAVARASSPSPDSGATGSDEPVSLAGSPGPVIEPGSPGHELLDEAEHHARTALDLREQLRDPTTYQTLNLLAGIAEARGDASSSAEWRARANAAYAEAQERAGAPSLPPDLVLQLAGLALTARQQQLSLSDALASAGADDPDAFLTTLDGAAPWLRPHLVVLADPNGKRPAVSVPEKFKDTLAGAWEATR
tara:strand:- start:76678 stop:81408 length:4731 start_codon:yes stop_codon:yes gene_type:complete